MRKKEKKGGLEKIGKTSRKWLNCPRAVGKKIKFYRGGRIEEMRKKIGERPSSAALLRVFFY